MRPKLTLFDQLISSSVFYTLVVGVSCLRGTKTQSFKIGTFPLHEVSASIYKALSESFNSTQARNVLSWCVSSVLRIFCTTSKLGSSFRISIEQGCFIGSRKESGQPFETSIAPLVNVFFSLLSRSIVAQQFDTLTNRGLILLINSFSLQVMTVFDYLSQFRETFW